MKLDDKFVIDEFPKEAGGRAFFTTLANIEHMKLTKNVKIYTSETLKRQMQIYYKNKGISLEDKIFRIFKPFKVYSLVLKKGGKYDLLPCISSETNTSFMLVFRKESRITHMYCGLATDIKTVMKNKTFNEWLTASGNSIDNFYAFISPSPHQCSRCELEKQFETIEQKLEDDNIAKLYIRLPLFGCEVFIAHLLSEYRGYVALNDILGEIFAEVPKADINYIAEDKENAAIIVSNTDMILDQNCPQNIAKTESVFEWSPLPSKIELKALGIYVCPENIHHIADIISYSIVQGPPVHITKFYFKNDNEESPKTTRDDGNNEKNEQSQIQRKSSHTTEQSLQSSTPKNKDQEVTSTTLEKAEPKKSTGTLKGIATNKLVYRQGKVGIIYTDDSD